MEKIKIGAFVFSVTRFNNFWRGDKKLDGHISHHQTSIEIEGEMNHQATTQVLLHEVVHGILQQANRDVDEETIDVLSFGIYQVMRDNPELVQMIVAEDVN